MMSHPMLGFCIALVVSAVLASAHAQAPGGKISVATSYSNELTTPMKKVFEAAHPGATLDV